LILRIIFRDLSAPDPTVLRAVLGREPVHQLAHHDVEARVSGLILVPSAVVQAEQARAAGKSAAEFPGKTDTASQRRDRTNQIGIGFALGSEPGEQQNLAAMESLLDALHHAHLFIAEPFGLILACIFHSLFSFSLNSKKRIPGRNSFAQKGFPPSLEDFPQRFHCLFVDPALNVLAAAFHHNDACLTEFLDMMGNRGRSDVQLFS